jgi:hypothetical protein
MDGAAEPFGIPDDLHEADSPIGVSVPIVFSVLQT